MTDSSLTAPSTSPAPRVRARRAVRSSLRTRLRVYALFGLVLVGGWVYYTVNTVLGLYDATLQIAQYTNLRERVTDALGALKEGSDSLDRYIREGQGYDLSQHYASRTTLKTSLGAIRRQGLPQEAGGRVRQAEASEEVYANAAEKAISARATREPGETFAIRDNQAVPAATTLREVLSGLELDFARAQAISELRLKSERDAATTALVVLAALILSGLFWLMADVNRRILAPCTEASRALGELVAGRPTPRLPDLANDEIGELGANFNTAARLYGERFRALEARDIESSVNAVLAAAATVNDLAGFGTKLLERVLEVTGASSAVLYVPDGRGDIAPAVSIGGAEGRGAAGREEARRALREEKPILVSVDAQTPTVDLFDGRILPRESLHLPLTYFGEVVGVLGLGSVRPFSERARNTLTSIAPSLAVALANASANQRLTEQSRRLAEQNELLEEQRSRIARTARELQRASALKDRFLAAVSHELRTPMTVILGFTGTLLRGTQGALNADQRESLERVQRNARLLLGLINDVLDISKIESGKADVRREVISVATLVRPGRVRLRGRRPPQGPDPPDGRFRRSRQRGQRRSEARTDPHQPRQQRPEVHRTGDSSRSARSRAARSAGCSPSRIPESEFPSRSRKPIFAGVPPGRVRAAPGPRGNRPGAGHRPQARDSPGRNGLGPERGRRGRHVRRQPSEGAARGVRAGSRSSPWRAPPSAGAAFSSSTTTRTPGVCCASSSSPTACPCSRRPTASRRLPSRGGNGSTRSFSTWSCREWTAGPRSGR